MGDIRFSPDGRWWWDGKQWQPVQPRPRAVTHPPRSTTGPQRARSNLLPTWAKIVLGLFFLPITAYVLVFRSGWKPATKMVAAAGWSAVLVASLALTSSSYATGARPSPQTAAPTAATGTAASTSTVTPTPTGTPMLGPTPTPVLARASAPAALVPAVTHTPTPPPAAPARDLCGAPSNPWGYNFCGGSFINSPPSNFCSYFTCIPNFWRSTNGYVDQCADGAYSHSGGRQGACSFHGGERRPLYGP